MNVGAGRGSEGSDRRRADGENPLGSGSSNGAESLSGEHDDQLAGGEGGKERGSENRDCFDEAIVYLSLVSSSMRFIGNFRNGCLTN